MQAGTTPADRTNTDAARKMSATINPRLHPSYRSSAARKEAEGEWSSKYHSLMAAFELAKELEKLGRESYAHKDDTM